MIGQRAAGATKRDPAPLTGAPAAGPFTARAPEAESAADGVGPRWAGLHRTGAAAALVTALLVPVAILAHVLWPPPSWAPGAAGDWFAYIQANRLAGLLNLDLAMEVGLLLAVPLYLTLAAALGRAQPAATAVATATALLGTLLHILANAAVEMAALADAHAIATTDAQRAVYLAAGEAALSSYYGTVFQASYVLGYAAYVLYGAVMLRSAVFGRTTGWLAVVTGVAGFGFYLPAVGLLLSVVVVVLVAVWNVLVARRLFELAGAPT